MRLRGLVSALVMTMATVTGVPAQVTASSPAYWQIALDRANFSPGCIDGKLGRQTQLAIQAWQEARELKVDGVMGPETDRSLLGDTTDWFTEYAVTEADFAQLGPVPETWKGKSDREQLPYETILELMAERFHSAQSFLKLINPAVDFGRLSTNQVFVVPNVLVARVIPRASVVRVSLTNKIIVVYDERDRVVGCFPCSIGKDKARRPVGELKVAAIAPNPNFTWDPVVFAESPEARTVRGKLIIPPGPNNPVGVCWLGLSQAGYGIHGTPKPEEIGRTESHGCFRVANWNIEILARMIEVGTPVLVDD